MNGTFSRRMQTVAFALPILLLFVTNACEFQVSTANISNAYLISSMAEAADSTHTFNGYTPAVFCMVDVANAPEGTTSKAIWYEMDRESGEYAVLDSADISLEGSDEITFSYTPPEMIFPYGDYKVELYLNGDFDRELEFSVEPSFTQGPVTEFVMSTKVNELGKPVDPAYVVPPSSELIYCNAYFTGSEEPMLLATKWYMVTDDGSIELPEFTSSINIAQETWINFSVTLTDPLDFGEYAVELYANDALYDRINFSIVNPAI